MFIVFLNDKLISVDSFLPLALELSRRFPGRSWQFYVFDQRTLDAIRGNPLINEGLALLGPVRLFTDHRRTSRNEKSFYRGFMRLRALIMLAKLASLTVLKRPVFIHFRALNVWPLRFLYLLNQRRTHLVQPSAVGSSETEQAIEHTVRKRRSKKTPRPAACYIAHYTDHWDVLKAEVSGDIPRVRLPTPFTLPSWADYLDQRCRQDFLHVGMVPEDEIVGYMLNTMSSAELLSPKTTFLEMFEHTLQILAQELPDLPVVVKRHPATSPDTIRLQDEIVGRMRSQTGHKIIVANLHPQIVAQRARCFVGNWYSTTFYNAVILGVPTVQYAVCSDAVRQQARGGNIRADLVSYFFDDEEMKFRACLRTLPPRGATQAMRGRARAPENDDAVGRWAAVLAT